MGDCNAPMNPGTKTKVPAIKIVEEWEKSGKVRTLNDKNRPTRVPTLKEAQANCVDLAFVTPGITAKGVTFTLDETRAWTPISTLRGKEESLSFRARNLSDSA